MQRGDGPTPDRVPPVGVVGLADPPPKHPAATAITNTRINPSRINRSDAHYRPPVPNRPAARVSHPARVAAAVTSAWQPTRQRSLFWRTARVTTRVHSQGGIRWAVSFPRRHRVVVNCRRRPPIRPATPGRVRPDRVAGSGRFSPGCGEYRPSGIRSHPNDFTCIRRLALSRDCTCLGYQTGRHHRDRRRRSSGGAIPRTADRPTTTNKELTSRPPAPDRRPRAGLASSWRSPAPGRRP
jgi:hypothetical protein